MLDDYLAVALGGLTAGALAVAWIYIVTVSIQSLAARLGRKARTGERDVR